MRELFRVLIPATATICVTICGSVHAAAASQDMPETSVEAIRAYADGAEAYLASRYGEAIPHFMRAHELDPTFFTPVFMHYISARNIGRAGQADSLIVVLQANRNRLSPYYQGLLDAYVLRGQGQAVEAAAMYRHILDLYPSTKAAYNYAQYVWTSHPEDALRALSQLDPDREPIRGWLAYWTVRGNVLHTLGDLDGFLDNAREARRRHPDQPGPLIVEINALAALGRIEEMNEAMNRAKAFPAFLPGVSLRTAGQELMAHGHHREGLALVEQSIAWYDSADTRTSVAALSGRAFGLYLLGRHAEAATAYRALVERAPNNTNFNVLLGVTAAQSGDRQTAESILQRSVNGQLGGSVENDFGDQAMLHAALGDAIAAKEALFRFARRPHWVGHDPVLLRVLGEDPQFIAFIQTGNTTH